MWGWVQGPLSRISTQGRIGGGWSKHSHHIETREGGVGVGTRSPILCFNTRGLGDSRNTSIVSKHERGVREWVPEPPVSLFDARVGWRVVKTFPSHRNMRGVWGWGTRAPRLAFRCEGGVGRWLKHPHHIETQERVWGWVPEPSVSLFDVREGLVGG